MMSIELWKVASQILELYFFHSFSFFSKLRFPPLSPGLIIHRLFVAWIIFLWYKYMYIYVYFINQWLYLPVKIQLLTVHRIQDFSLKKTFFFLRSQEILCFLCVLDLGDHFTKSHPASSDQCPVDKTLTKKNFDFK